MEHKFYTEAFNQFNKPLIHFASELTWWDSSLAEDVVTDAFIDLHKKWKEFLSKTKHNKEEILSLSWSYLKIAVRNRCYDSYRKYKTVKKYSGLFVEEYSEITDTADIKTSLMERVCKELDELPEKRKESVLMWVHGYKQKEIAEVMNISQSTAGTHIFEALRHLKNILINNGKPKKILRQPVVIGETYCRNGHLMTEENTYVFVSQKSTAYECKKCRNVKIAEYRKRKKQLVA